jgi:hypothetical protein
MPKTLVTALVVATILAAGLPANRAAAMTIAAAAASPPGMASANHIREAAVVCGGNGCNPVQTKVKKRRKFIPLRNG